MTDVDYDEQSGTLIADADQLDALVAIAAGKPANSDRASELDGSGALLDGRPRPELDAPLGAIRSPVCTLTLVRGTRHGEGFVDPMVSVLITPDEDGRRRMVTVPTPFLPDALARLNDLRPRPRAAHAIGLRFDADELSEILAAGDADRAAQLAGADPASGLARGIVDHFNERWMVESSWRMPDGSTGTRRVSVIDTSKGVWTEVADGAAVDLYPSTPTAVWRLLTDLLPDSRELADAGMASTH